MHYRENVPVLYGINLSLEYYIIPSLALMSLLFASLIPFESYEG